MRSFGLASGEVNIPCSLLLLNSVSFHLLCPLPQRIAKHQKCSHWKTAVVFPLKLLKGLWPCLCFLCLRIVVNTASVIPKHTKPKVAASWKERAEAGEAEHTRPPCGWPSVTVASLPLCLFSIRSPLFPPRVPVPGHGVSVATSCHSDRCWEARSWCCVCTPPPATPPPPL